MVKANGRAGGEGVDGLPGSSNFLLEAGARPSAERGSGMAVCPLAWVLSTSGVFLRMQRACFSESSPTPFPPTPRDAKEAMCFATSQPCGGMRAPSCPHHFLHPDSQPGAQQSRLHPFFSLWQERD